MKTTRRVLEPHKWRWQRNRARRTDHVDLWRRRLEIRFLFGILAFVHGVTKQTGMRAIESLSDGLAQRRVLRVFNHHRSPRDRLKRDPMQTDRAAERENRHDAANTANHARETSEPAEQCQSMAQFVLVFRSRRNKSAVAFVEINCRPSARDLESLSPRSRRKLARRFDCFHFSF